MPEVSGRRDEASAVLPRPEPGPSRSEARTGRDRVLPVAPGGLLRGQEALNDRIAGRRRWIAACEPLTSM